jgi:hypothetical protein
MSEVPALALLNVFMGGILVILSLVAIHEADALVALIAGAFAQYNFWVAILLSHFAGERGRA